jgi:hypothetical protein
MSDGEEAAVTASPHNDLRKILIDAASGHRLSYDAAWAVLDGWDALVAENERLRAALDALMRQMERGSEAVRDDEWYAAREAAYVAARDGDAT